MKNYIGKTKIKQEIVKKVCCKENCRSEFCCDNRCEIVGRVKTISGCFCPKCAKEDYEGNKSFYESDGKVEAAKCVWRFG